METQSTTPLTKPAKFEVYKNPAISYALSKRDFRPRPSHFLLIGLWFSSSVWTTWIAFSRGDALVAVAEGSGLAPTVARILMQGGQWLTLVYFFMSISALLKAISLQAASDANLAFTARSTRNKSAPVFETVGNSRGWKLTELSEAALGVPGTRTRQRLSHTSSPVLLVPIHPQASNKKLVSSSWSRYNGQGGSARSSGQVNTTSSPARNMSGSPYQVTNPPGPHMATPASRSSSVITSPWSREITSLGNDAINSEEKFTKFLAEVSDGLNKSPGFSTPPPTIQGVGTGSSPNTTQSSLSLLSTPRSGSLRALRMSPIAPKTGSPKKGETEMPPPMSMEQTVEGFKKLGVYLYIDQWRDGIRQWFSEVLLNPLIWKLDNSHVQAMTAAAQLGISISVAKIGSINQDGVGAVPSLPDCPPQEWLTTIVPDEDSTLYQLRASLLQARDGPLPSQNTVFGLTPPRGYNPALQACLDAVTEHQRLKALVKGEWVKGLLPHSTVRADYTVQRIQELARGTCVKDYEYRPNGEVYDKFWKRWTSDLPSDSHLLLYLFCALLEHPQWMLHVDPNLYPSTQTGNNSLFIASLPHKERYPEKYIAIISGPPPSALHAGATVLAVGKTNASVFALYWDKKLQFSFQGRQALWDAVLLLCYRIKVAHGGVVRGISLGSSAFNLLSLLDPSMDTSPGN